MPSAGVPARPQTLKQAKRAYQRSGKTRQLSARERAEIQRRAELQERANRIREREARKKANAKKREERLAREKEKAAKLGKPIETGKNWHIGPSQLDLGRFLQGLTKNGAGVHPQDPKAGYQKETEDETRGPVQAIMAPPPRPLMTGAVEDVPTYDASQFGNTNGHTMIGEHELFEDMFVSNTQIERELSPAMSSIDEETPIKPAHQEATHVSLNKLPPQNNTNRHLKPLVNPPSDLLIGISTQDVSYEPTQRPSGYMERHQPKFPSPPQPTTQDHFPQRVRLFSGNDSARSFESQKAALLDIDTKSCSSSFSADDDLTDHDLQDLVTAVESGLASSSAKGCIRL